LGQNLREEHLVVGASDHSDGAVAESPLNFSHRVTLFRPLGEHLLCCSAHFGLGVCADHFIVFFHSREAHQESLLARLLSIISDRSRALRHRHGVGKGCLVQTIIPDKRWKFRRGATVVDQIQEFFAVDF